MPRERSAVPAYRFHKPTGQAVVTIRTPSGGRRDVYLGSHGSPASREEYARVLKSLDRPAEATPAAVPLPAVAAPSVAEVLLAFLRHADTYYRRPDGTDTSEASLFRHALRIVREEYANLPAREFGPLALKRVRDRMVAKGWTRNNVNAQVGRVRRAFRWAVENELVPAGVWDALRAVRGLAPGRTPAPDPEPVRPVPPRAVALALRHLPPVVAAMVRFQWLTGCRPQDACKLRVADIDRSGATWVFRPAAHKGSWRGAVREVFVGPKAQRLIEPWLVGAADGFVFSPRAGVASLHAARGEARTTPRYPSHMRRNAAKRAANPRRTAGERYSVGSYGRAVNRACEAAGIQPWCPLQLRHSAGTRFRHRFGIETARVLLGHRSVVTSEIYAEPDRRKAAPAMRAAG